MTPRLGMRITVIERPHLDMMISRISPHGTWDVLYFLPTGDVFTLTYQQSEQTQYKLQLAGERSLLRFLYGRAMTRGISTT